MRVIRYGSIAYGSGRCASLGRFCRRVGYHRLVNRYSGLYPYGERCLCGRSGGNLQFETWKYGVVNVDNVLVATPDMEAQVFSDGFDPENIEASVDATGELTGTWGEIKSQ